MAPEPSKISVWNGVVGFSVVNVLTVFTGWPPLSVPVAVTVNVCPVGSA